MRESGFDRYGPVHTAPLIRRRRRIPSSMVGRGAACSMRSSRSAAAVP